MGLLENASRKGHLIWDIKGQDAAYEREAKKSGVNQYSAFSNH